MKHSLSISIYLTVGILLVGCGQATIPPMPAHLAAMHTAAVATAYVELTKIASITVTSHVNITPTSSIKPTFTPIPQPTILPTLEPTKIPGLLQSALSVETLASFNGHNLGRVTGWVYGFYGFEWMNTNYLLVHPIVGQTDTNNFGRLYETHQAFINIGAKKVWIPQYPSRWSAQLGYLISSGSFGSEDGVAIYSPDGNLIKVYKGTLLDVSPSGTKILIGDDTWIDLITGKTVDFAWYKNYEGFANFHYAIWSPDETRVYTCCYLYGDANTGESFGIPYDNITIDGKKVDPKRRDSELFNSYGTWVLNDKYLLSQWDGFYDSTPSFIPLFDPVARTYRNLSKLAGIPTDSHPNCHRTEAISGGRYVWANCDEGGYLIDLSTFKSKAYPHFNISDIEWSADGKFAWVDGSIDFKDGSTQILSVESQELKSLPTKPLFNQSLCWT